MSKKASKIREEVKVKTAEEIRAELDTKKLRSTRSPKGTEGGRGEGTCVRKNGSR